MLLSTLVAGSLLAASSVDGARDFLNAKTGKGFFPKAGSKPFDQEILDQYNLLNFFGGWGPYMNNKGFGIERNVPDGCEVDQVLLLARHGERFADKEFPGEQIEQTLAKMVATNISTYQGSLSFLNKDWHYTPVNRTLYSQETWTGPYSGLLETFRFGALYADRYEHLWDGSSVVPLFASGEERVINTARYFGMGFFGYNYSTNAALNIISESKEQGANSLTPSCFLPASGICDTVPTTMPIFKVAAARLNAETPGLNLTSDDIAQLMTLAAFEVNYHASSPWTDVFTLDEWVAYEHTQNLFYYYCDGPGTNTSQPLGQLYLNSTLSLMQQGPEEVGPLFFSFVHDTQVVPAINSLGLYIPHQDLPLQKVPFWDNYRGTQMVPMGGRLLLERMTCKATPISDEGVYVRVIVNEAVQPLPDCVDGPGYSCSLSTYACKINALPKYTEACAVPANLSQELTFFTSPSLNTSLDFHVGEIPAFQELTTEGEDVPAFII